MILHLLRMRRNVNRNVFNARENVSATAPLLHKCTIVSRERVKTGDSLIDKLSCFIEITAIVLLLTCNMLRSLMNHCCNIFVLNGRICLV